MDTSDQAFQGGFGQADDNSLDFACLLDGGLGPPQNDQIDNSDDQNSYAYGTGKLIQ